MRAYWFGGIALPHNDGRPVAVGVTHTHDGEIVPCKSGLHASAHPMDALAYACTNQLWLVELGGTILPHGTPVDKHAASERTYLARIDAEPLLREFARWCALQVVPVWNCPDVVRQYLETGDEEIRDAAWDAACDAANAACDAANAACDAANAARDAAWAAAWDAACDAANAACDAANAARDAACDAANAACDAANAACDAANAARDAAWDAAWDAACDAANAACDAANAARDAAWDATRAATRAAARDAAWAAQRDHLKRLVDAAFEAVGVAP